MYFKGELVRAARENGFKDHDLITACKKYQKWKNDEEAKELRIRTTQIKRELEVRYQEIDAAENSLSLCQTAQLSTQDRIYDMKLRERVDHDGLTQIRYERNCKDLVGS